MGTGIFPNFEDRRFYQDLSKPSRGLLGSRPQATEKQPYLCVPLCPLWLEGFAVGFNQKLEALL
jgi:hypothetical protein